jgi:signal transduction histidine kinase
MIALLGVVAVLVLAGLYERFGAAPLDLLFGLRTSAAALAVIVAVIAHFYWRATGLVFGAHLATGAWLLAASSGVGLLTVDVLSVPEAAWLRIALSGAAVVWCFRAVLGPEVDTSVRPVAEAFFAGTCATAIVMALGWVAPGLIARAGTPALFFAGLSIGVAWAGVAAASLVRGSKVVSPPYAWLAWLAAALAVAELIRYLQVLHAGDWLLAPPAAWAWGLLVAAFGVAEHLSDSALTRRGVLHEAELRHQEQERVREEHERIRAHEFRNALFAIDGATRTLERYRASLSTTEQAELADAISSGIDRLRDIVESRGQRPDVVDLLRLATSQAALLRGRGVGVRVTGDAGVRAVADHGWCGQILANLLTNAVRHGDADRNGVTLRVTGDEERALLEVADAGPGIPAELREQIFIDGVRLHPDRQGEGRGLPHARRLAREQGGDLWVKGAPADGGACFVLALPRVRGPLAPDEVVDEVEQGTEVVETPAAAAVGERDDPAAPRCGTGVEVDDHGGIGAKDLSRGDDEVDTFRRRGLGK